MIQNLKWHLITCSGNSENNVDSRKPAGDDSGDSPLEKIGQNRLAKPG
jgi:hypothetical protein